MLNTLRRIVQEVNAAQDLAQALAIIVSRVKAAMSVDVCSVYLLDGVRDEYVLRATDGLNPAAIGSVRLARGEGLISVVGASEEPLNLDNAPAHPPNGRSCGQSFGPCFRVRPLPLPLVGAGNAIIPARCSRSRPTRALISFGCPSVLVHSSARHTLRAISERIGGLAKRISRRIVSTSAALSGRPHSFSGICSPIVRPSCL